MADKNKLLLEGVLDEARTKSNINKQLPSLIKEIQKKHKIRLGVELDEKATQQKIKTLTTLFNKIANAASQTKLSDTTAGKIGTSLSNILLAKIKKSTNKETMRQLEEDITQALQEMANVIYEIDTAMTKLYQVTDETDIRYNTFLKNACNNAKELGRSVSSLVEQAANWSELGYTLDQAEKLAKISSIYANIGGMSDTTAISDLVTIMKAFDIEAANTISIVDKLNTLGHNSPASTQDLGTGLSASASALASAGNSIDEALGLLTAMTEVTQNAREASNDLTILSMRIHGMKEELEALGEETDGIGSIQQIQTEILNLTNGKVNIFEDTDAAELKSTYDIIKGIADEWDNISQTNQEALLEIIAGSQRSSSVSGLLTNMAQAKDALMDSMNSNGSAYQEQEEWLNSLEGKAAQLDASFQALSSTTLDSDLLKFFVDLGTTGVSALDFIISKFGVLTTLLAAGGGTTAIAQFIKNLDYQKVLKTA